MRFEQWQLDAIKAVGRGDRVFVMCPRSAGRTAFRKAMKDAELVRAKSRG